MSFDPGRIHVDIHIHHHFDTPIPIDITKLQSPPRRAERAVITFDTGEETLGAQLTIDDTGKGVQVQFLDDRGDTNALPPASNDGAPLDITFSTDDPAVCTIASDPSNPQRGQLTPVAEGNCNVNTAITNGDGTPVLEPDGVTPFTVAQYAITVGPGLAVSAQLEESDTPSPAELVDAHTKAELLDAADAAGVDVPASGTKADIAETLVQEGVQPPASE